MDWQRVVTGIARLYGWAWYHTHDSRHSAAGFPDLVLVKPPRLLTVELKRDPPAGRPPTVAQLRWLGLLAATGVEVAVWRPVDQDRVAECLGPAARWAGGNEPGTPYLR